MSVIFCDYAEKFFVAVLDLLDLRNTNEKNVCLCVSVGRVFLYLNNNRSSPNFTRVFLSITPREVFYYLFEVRIISQIFDLYKYLKKNWSCRTFFLRDSRLTDHNSTQKISTFFLKNFSTQPKFQKFQVFKIFVYLKQKILFVPRLTDPYERPKLKKKIQRKFSTLVQSFRNFEF